MAKEDYMANTIYLKLSAKELTVLQAIQNPSMYPAIFIKKHLLETVFKQKFMELYGENDYNEALARASRTIVQIQQEKANAKLGKRKDKIKTETLMVEIESLSSEHDRKFLDYVNEKGISDMDFDSLSDKMKVEWFLKWKKEIEDAFQKYGKKVEMV
jgi:hypothetical protein